MKTKIKFIHGRKLTLARGPVARVYFCAARPCGEEKPLRFWRLVAGRERTTWHTIEELETLNSEAEKMNAAARRFGEAFAIPTRDEENALRLWREFCAEGTEDATPGCGRRQPPSLSEVLAAALRRERERDETPTVAETAERWLAEKERTGGVRAKWLGLLRSRLSFFVRAFGDSCRMAAVSVERVQGLLETQGFTPKTRHHYVAALRGLYAWHYGRENALRRPSDHLVDPLAALPLPRVPKLREPEIVDAPTLRAFLVAVAAIEPSALAAFALQAFCGLRLAEAAAVRREDIRGGDENGGHFVFLSCAITKTKIARVAPVPPCALAWLRAARADASTGVLALPAASSAATDEREERLYRIKIAAARAAGVRVPKNALRHSAVSYLAALYGQAFAADACGHSIRTQGVFYRAAATPEQARAWFAVFPPPEIREERRRP